MNRLLLSACLVWTLTSSACGSGNQLTDPAPMPKAGDALGEQACDPTAGSTSPLLVDMKDHDRAEIEVVLDKQIAVVSFDCRKLRVLSDCTVVDGAYGYVGFNRKERVMRLESEDEISANLPTFGLAWAGELSAELEQGASLDIALVTVGRRATTLNGLRPEHLKGRCEGATHFVKRAYSGAFAVEAGSAKSARTAVEIFGAGAKAGTGSSTFERVSDGQLDACAKAKTDDVEPPEGCGALLRLELLALGEASKTDDEDAQPSCPSGMVFVGGKCTVGTAWARCQAKDDDACRDLCAAGEAEACTMLGRRQLAAGETADGVKLLSTACDAGDGEGCYALARHHGQTDPQSSMPGHRRACDLGNASGCDEWATLMEQHKGQTATEAERKNVLLAWQRACHAGNGHACEKVALHYIEPDPKKRVFEPDEQQAFKLMMQQCLVHKLGCGKPAMLLEGRSWCEISRSDPRLCAPPPTSKRPLKRDPDRALNLYRQLCPSHDCVPLARFDALGTVPFEDAKVAYAHEACGSDSKKKWDRIAQPLQCAIGMAKDPSRAKEHQAKACAMSGGLERLTKQMCANTKSANDKKYCWDGRNAVELAKLLCSKLASGK